MGNFGDTYYDKSLLNDMLEDMMIKDEKEIFTLLPEELLRSFFRVISPLRRKELLSSDIVHCDETPVQVLKKEGK